MNSELVEKHQFLYHYLKKKIRSLIKYSKGSSLNLCCFAGGGVRGLGGTYLCAGSKAEKATKSPAHPLPSLPRFASVACPPLKKEENPFRLENVFSY